MELRHHGIMGMKWGVRRYQNPDGSLTAQGKVHYGVGDEKRLEKDQKKFDKKVGKNFHKAYNKAAREMNSKHISEINKKYKNVDLEKDRAKYEQYIKDFDSVWREVYGNALLDKFGERPELDSAEIDGRNWVNNAPYMDMYISSLE